MVSGAPKFYNFQDRKRACVFCSLLSEFFFVGDKIAANHFKDAIIPSLKANDRPKFSQDVEMNHAKEKVKTQCKNLYKAFKRKYGYDPLLDISTFPN